MIETLSDRISQMYDQLLAAIRKEVVDHNRSVNTECGKLQLGIRYEYDFVVNQPYYPNSITLRIKRAEDIRSIDYYYWTRKDSDSDPEHVNHKLWLHIINDRELRYTDNKKLMTVEETARMLIDPILSSAKHAEALNKQEESEVIG